MKDLEKELTVEEVVEYEKTHKPVVHTYGKYGTLAKKYLEEHKQGKLWSLGGDLPAYLHGIDKQAEELYEAMRSQLSKQDQYKKSGNYLEDLRIEAEMEKIIEEEILTSLVYVD